MEKYAYNHFKKWRKDKKKLSLQYKERIVLLISFFTIELSCSYLIYFIFLDILQEYKVVLLHLLFQIIFYIFVIYVSENHRVAYCKEDYKTHISYCLSVYRILIKLGLNDEECLKNIHHRLSQQLKNSTLSIKDFFQKLVKSVQILIIPIILKLLDEISKNGYGFETLLVYSTITIISLSIIFSLGFAALTFILQTKNILDTKKEEFLEILQSILDLKLYKHNKISHIKVQKKGSEAHVDSQNVKV